MKILSDHIDWARQEFGGATIGDKRLRERLLIIAATLAAKPNESIPQACGDKASAKAAYRFFDNAFVDPEDIGQGHRLSTLERCKAVELVLAAQDTTYLDYDHHPATKGLGPYSTGKAQGLLMHSTLALTPERLPLGLIDRLTWARDPEEEGRRGKRKELPIEFKESYKWLSSLNMTNEAAQHCPNTRFINIGDREADVYDLFLVERHENVDLLVRASWNRAVDHPESYLFAHVESLPLAGTLTLNVPSRKKQPARQAKLELRYGQVSLRPPRHRTGEKLKKVELKAIQVREVDAPKGAEPVHWLLLTTREVQSVEDALTCVKWYSCRWSCELFHFTLKSGCKIEERQLREAARLERCLAVLVVVAWRLLYLTMLGRVLPEESCELVLGRSEWEALCCVVERVGRPPAEPPTLRKANLMIAGLGGFLGRRGDGEPGVKRIWKGLQRLSDFTLMYEAMRAAPPDLSRDRSG